MNKLFTFSNKTLSLNLMINVKLKNRSLFLFIYGNTSIQYPIEALTECSKILGYTTNVVAKEFDMR